MHVKTIISVIILVKGKSILFVNIFVVLICSVAAEQGNCILFVVLQLISRSGQQFLCLGTFEHGKTFYTDAKVCNEPWTILLITVRRSLGFLGVSEVSRAGSKLWFPFISRCSCWRKLRKAIWQPGKDSWIIARFDYFLLESYEGPGTFPIQQRHVHAEYS